MSPTERGRRRPLGSYRRIRAVGEPPLPLSDIAPRSTAFVLAQRTVGGVQRRIPIGTAFFVAVPVSDRSRVSYLVTAAHVVRTEPQAWVRLSLADGGVEDFPVHEWVFHPTEDVAATPFDKPGDANLQWTEFHPSNFADVWWTKKRHPGLGDRVYYMGLLSDVEAMGDRNIPMVRSGTIGALFQERIPLRLSPIDLRYVTAHLIDCYSFAGFSGSPCLVQYEESLVNPKPGVALTIRDTTLLLGMIAAHFDSYRTAKVTGDFQGEVNSPINAGVAVVTPVEIIRQTLEMEELVEDRERRAAEADEQEAGAVPDSVEGSDFDKFSDLAKKVVSVPKEEIDAAEAAREKRTRG